MLWGTFAWIPIAGEIFPTQIACILLSNLGESFAEVANDDALVAELGRTRKSAQLQSYAFIALAAGAMSGNLSGRFILLIELRSRRSCSSYFSLLISVQLAISLSAKETPLCIPISQKFETPIRTQCLAGKPWQTILRSCDGDQRGNHCLSSLVGCSFSFCCAHSFRFYVLLPNAVPEYRSFGHRPVKSHQSAGGSLGKLLL